MTVPCFIINLKQSGTRRLHMEAQLSRLQIPYRFVDAIDGSALLPEHWQTYDRRRRRLFFGHDLTPGEIGCLLSHRAVYRHMIENSIPCALVLEDDTILSDAFVSTLASLRASPVQWDMIRFLCNKKVYARTRILTPLHDNCFLGRPRGLPGGAYSYLLTLKAAKALYRKMDRNWIPVDTLHGQVWRTRLRVYNVLPSPITIDKAMESTIGEDRFNKKTNSLSKRERVLFPLTRMSMKLYEMFWKNIVQVATWPHDMYIRYSAGR